MSSVKLAQTMLQYVAASSALHERLLAENQKFAAEKKAAAALRPQVLDLLLSTGSISPNEKAAAAGSLSSHTDTLDLLGRAVTALGESRKQMSKLASAENQLGRPDFEKTAQAVRTAPTSLTSPFVGAPTSRRRESDNALSRILNAPGS